MNLITFFLTTLIATSVFAGEGKLSVDFHWLASQINIYAKAVGTNPTDCAQKLIRGFSNAKVTNSDGEFDLHGDLKVLNYSSKPENKNSGSITYGLLGKFGINEEGSLAYGFMRVDYDNAPAYDRWASKTVTSGTYCELDHSYSDSLRIYYQGTNDLALKAYHGFHLNLE